MFREGRPDMSGEHPDRGRPVEGSEDWSVISRRTLLRAGWTAPVILTVAPSVAFAASGSTTTPPVGPGGGKTPKSGTPGSGSGGPGTTGPGAPGPGGTGSPGLPEQSSQGPQPARINRGFTG